MNIDVIGTNIKSKPPKRTSSKFGAASLNMTGVLKSLQGATTRPGNLFTEKLSDDYHSDSKTGYHIPLVTYACPQNRRLKVITIGAGYSGIMLAYNIEKRCDNIEHVIYEKNPDLGGTWVCIQNQDRSTFQFLTLLY